MTRYAERTSVDSGRSRAEIEKTITRYGATGFMYYWRGDRAVIGFELQSRGIRFQLDMPDRNERRFTHTDRGKVKSTEAANKHYEQATRQRWRALALVIKAKLEAVESGIVEFDEEFMAHIVMPDGQTMGEAALPKMQAVLEGRSPTLMLPDYSQ